MTTELNTPTVPTSKRLEEFFAKVDPVRGRLIFAIDATSSRQPTWDMAAKTTAQIFDAVAAIGVLGSTARRASLATCRSF